MTTAVVRARHREDSTLRRIVRENGLSIVLVGLFLAFVFAQSVAGLYSYNNDRGEHGQSPVMYGQYLTSGHFLGALFENWESEFLQMAAYVLLTVALYQKGSSESKSPDEEEEVDEDPRDHRDDPHAPRPVRAGGWQLAVYEHSLSLALGTLFLLSFVLHAWSGWRAHSEELLEHGRPAEGVIDFLGNSQFWFESFQNWQSEFLAVAAIVVLSIFLRERGSPESKPVAAAHYETGSG